MLIWPNNRTALRAPEGSGRTSSDHRRFREHSVSDRVILDVEFLPSQVSQAGPVAPIVRIGTSGQKPR